MSKHLLPFGRGTSRHALQWALLRAIYHGEMERLDWFPGFYNAIIVHIVGDEFQATTPLILVIGKIGRMTGWVTHMYCGGRRLAESIFIFID